MTLQEAFDLGFEAVKAYVDDGLAKLDQRLTLALAQIPKCGIGLAGALIDQDGALNLTMSDGTIHKLGRVVGKDGEPGKPGKDGFGFEDLDVAQLNERDVLIRFVRGEDKKEFPLRFGSWTDRGVYKADTAYQAGDGVTWGGSFWIAQRETSDKPETSDAWRLAVKRGRDGKDARALPPLPNGAVKA